MKIFKIEEEKLLEKDFAKTLGKRMGKIQKQKKLTDQEVANRMGIPKQSYSNMKSNGSITLYRFFLFISAVNPALNELIYGQEPPKDFVPYLKKS